MVRLAWLGFTPDTTEGEARAIYAARYGSPPAQVLKTGGGILAGPLPWAEDAGALVPRPGTPGAQEHGQLGLWGNG